MGIDLMLRMEGAKKSDLSTFLKSEGFEPGKSIAPQRGCSYFYWFEDLEYRSLSGVEASLIPGHAFPDFNDADLILAVRCKIWGSVHDVAKMNDVVRGARKKFGGQVDGDYGKNRYIPLWEDRSTPLSRGVSRAYDRTLEVLDSLKYAIPNENINPPVEGLADATSSRIFEMMQMHDPARVVFNGLMPMVVAVLEHYFAEIFLVLAQHDADARDKFRETKVPRGLTGEELLGIAGGEILPESVIAREYSFQSVAGLSTTFRQWFNFDLKKILAPRKRILSRTDSLLDAFSMLIEYRHDVVHRLALDRTLSRNGLLYQIEVATQVIEVTTEAIGQKYGFVVERI